MASTRDSLIPPLPGDAEETSRRAEARRRRRLMEGAWRADAAEKIRAFLKQKYQQKHNNLIKEHVKEGDKEF